MSQNQGFDGLMICPGYDDFSNLCLKVVEDLRESVVLLSGEKASRGNFLDYVEDRNQGAVVIFLGHGTQEYLLTAPRLSDRVIFENQREFGCLLSDDELDSLSRKGLFAYCCSFGARLPVGLSEKGVKIVAFEDDIPFVKVHGVIDPTFLVPIQALLEECEDYERFLRQGFATVTQCYEKCIEGLKEKARLARGSKVRRNIRLALRYQLDLLVESS